MLTFFLEIIISVNPHIHMPHQKSIAYPSYINHRLKSEVSITFRCQLCLTHHTAIWINYCSKSTVATMKNVSVISVMKGNHHVQLPNWHFSMSAKMNGMQRRTLVCPRRMHCTYILRYAKRHLATLNSEKIKPVALAVIRYEGIQ